MGTMFNGLADALLLQSLLICVVFLLAAAACRALRGASAHWRYLVWLLVIAKCLTPPVVSLALPILRSSPLAGDSSPALDAPQAPTAKTSRAARESIASELPTPAVVTRQPGKPSAPATDALPAAPIATTAATSQWTARAWLAAAWAIGCSLFGASTAAKIWRTHQRLRKTRTAVDAATQQLVADLARQLGMGKSPSAYVTAAAGQPFVWGWFGGSIYLPPHFAGMGDAVQRRTVLMHELAHVARRDAAVNLVQLFTQALFFFHPLVWLANRELRKEREKCCDEIVLSHSFASPRRYCEAIVEVMAQSIRGVHAAPALAVAGDVDAVEQRIAAILTPNRQFARRASWRARGVLLAAACCILPTALVLTSRAEPAATSPPADAPIATPDESSDTPTAVGKDQWQPGQVLEVRLVDAQTQEPLEGVALELQNAGKGIDFQDVKEFTTDADGRARLPLPDLPPSAVRVYPTKSGYIPLRVYWEGAPWAELPASITIPLSRGHLFGGVVKNEAGEPIPGVQVAFDYWARGEGKAPHIRANVNAQATTDEQGRWHVDNMPPTIDESELRIFYKHPGYVSDWRRRGYEPLPLYPPASIEGLFDQTLVTTMRTGSEVRGKVVDESGAPIGGAAVHLDEQFYWWRKQEQPPRATTDDTGAFRIAGIEPKDDARLRQLGHSPLYLAIQAPGYAPELIGVDKGGDLPVVTLKRGHKLRGRVVDEAGKPLEGVGVLGRRWRGQADRLGVGMKSSADGSFELTDLPADEINYDFSKEGYMSIDGLAITPGEKEVVVTLKPPLKVSGRVIDADTKEPVNRFALVKGTDYDDGRAPDWQVYMTEQVASSRYETNFTQEGFIWRLRVEADGYLPAESRGFKPYAPDKGEIIWDVELHKAEPLTGTLLDPAGKPVAQADVYLATQALNVVKRQVPYHNDNRFTKTDEAGRFTFPAEVEPFCLVAIHPDGIAMVTEQEFAKSPTLQLEPWTADNEQHQIVRRPAKGQHVSFPPPTGD